MLNLRTRHLGAYANTTRYLKTLILLIFAVAMAGCAATKLTVDDGRKLDEKLLSQMKDYGVAAKMIRPAIVETAKLNDPECSKQYELPFEVLTSYGVRDEDTKVAWVRSLGVNEALSVIAVDPSVELTVGDIVQEVDGYSSSNTQKLVTKLVDLRDNGKPFKLKLASGRYIEVKPIEVCRGHVVVAPPGNALLQNYHWTASVHPLEVFRSPLSKEEAVWIVLWTQGLSEVGGARMKTYAFVVGGIKIVAFVGLTVATAGAAAAAGSGAAAAGATASAIAGQVAVPIVAGMAIKGVTIAAANKASLSGVNSIAGGVFIKADEWAFGNMKKLGMNPRAGLKLNNTLVEQAAPGNGFVLDEERLATMQKRIGELPEDATQVADSLDTARSNNHSDSAGDEAELISSSAEAQNNAAASPDGRTVKALDVTGSPAK